MSSPLIKLNQPQTVCDIKIFDDGTKEILCKLPPESLCQELAKMLIAVIFRSTQPVDPKNIVNPFTSRVDS